MYFQLYFFLLLHLYLLALFLYFEAFSSIDVVCDIALSSAPEVTSSYVTTWVRVGVNRARSLYDTSSFQYIPLCSVCFHRVLDDAFRLFLLVSSHFYAIPVPSVTHHSVEHSGYFVQYIRLSLSSLRRQVESPVL